MCLGLLHFLLGTNLSQLIPFTYNKLLKWQRSVEKDHRPQLQCWERLFICERRATCFGLYRHHQVPHYTGCPRRNVPDFGRMFLMLKYTDITQTPISKAEPLRR